MSAHSVRLARDAWCEASDRAKQLELGKVKGSKRTIAAAHRSEAATLEAYLAESARDDEDDPA